MTCDLKKFFTFEISDVIVTIYGCIRILFQLFIFFGQWQLVFPIKAQPFEFCLLFYFSITFHQIYSKQLFLLINPE